MENSLEDKQTYLRNQILQSGLDGQAFMAFMGTIKQQEESINLQNWTIQELHNVVDQFKKSIQQQIHQESLKVQSEALRHSKQMMTAKIMNNLQKKNKVFYEWNDLWDYEMQNEQECKKLGKYFVFKESPQISYKSWDIKRTGGYIFGMIGAKNQLEITLFCNFTQNKIIRKGQDITWLRNVLKGKFPGSFIPPLEQIRSVQPQDKTGIMKYIKNSIFFLNSLLSFQYLVHNQYFHAFMTESDPKKFLNVKNRSQILKGTTNITEIQTINGKFSVQISKRVLKFVEESSSYGQLAQQIYRDLQINIKKVLGDMETLAKHMHYIANNFAKLHERHNRMVQLCKINNRQDKSQKLSSIFVYLNNIFTTAGNQNKKSISILKQLSQEFIRYTHSQWSEFNHHHKKYTTEHYNYLNQKYNLIKKKQRCFSDVSKWQLDEREMFRMSRVNIETMNKQDAFEIMFPNDNKIEQDNKIWQAYINDMYQKSFRLLLEQQEKAYVKNCGKYCFKMERINQEQMEIYKKFNEIFVSDGIQSM